MADLSSPVRPPTNLPEVDETRARLPGDPIPPLGGQPWQPGQNTLTGNNDAMAGLRDSETGGALIPQRRGREEYEGENQGGSGSFDFSFGGASFPSEDHSGLVSRLVRRRKLTLDGDRDLTQFARESPEAKLIHVFAALLEVGDMLATQVAAQQYVLSKEAKNNIIKYATAAIFSPQCSAYVGPGVIDCVLDAMRTRNVDTLPAQDDVARTLIVRTAISEALTEKRYRLKTTIGKTLPQASPQPATDTEAAASSTPAAPNPPAAPFEHTDIATLCARIVKGTGVKVTLGFYHRVAFLRRTLVRCSDNTFWTTVDARLVKVRLKHSTQVAYDSYFAGCYDDDRSIHGQPPRQAGYVRANQVEEWQVTMEEQSRNAAAANAAHH